MSHLNLPGNVLSHGVMGEKTHCWVTSKQGDYSHFIGGHTSQFD